MKGLFEIIALHRLNSGFGLAYQRERALYGPVVKRGKMSQPRINLTALNSTEC